MPDRDKPMAMQTVKSRDTARILRPVTSAFVIDIAPSLWNEGLSRALTETEEHQRDHYVPDLHADDRENGDEDAHFGDVHGQAEDAGDDADIPGGFGEDMTLQHCPSD